LIVAAFNHLAELVMNVGFKRKLACKVGDTDDIGPIVIVVIGRHLITFSPTSSAFTKPRNAPPLAARIADRKRNMEDRVELIPKEGKNVVHTKKRNSTDELPRTV
jgi:hypothetical protein